MAIYLLNLGLLSRSQGRSSIQFSAYISGTKHKDVRTGELFRHTSKENVLVSQILAPEGAPDWALNPEVLWNHVEAFEDTLADKRFKGDPKDQEKDAKSKAAKEAFLKSCQSAQTVMGALPVELSEDEKKEVVLRFLKEAFLSRGLIVHYAIHDEKHNPHFHALVTRRPLKNRELSTSKDREIVSKSILKQIRKSWEVMLNETLEAGGHTVRVDSRSYKDRGIDLLGGLHEGAHAQRLEDLGKEAVLVQKNKAIQQRNLEILLEKPEILLQEMTARYTVFSKAALEKEILRRTGGDDRLFEMLASRLGETEYAPKKPETKKAQSELAGKLASAWMDNPNLVQTIQSPAFKGEGLTSKAHAVQEKGILADAEVLCERKGKVIEGVPLNPILLGEQKAAAKYLLGGPDLTLLNGRAGTGKTTLLRHVAEAYQKSGYTVIGSSFQGKAAETLGRELDIPTKTLDSLVFAWQRHQEQVNLVQHGRLFGRSYLYAHQKMKRLEKERLTPKHVVIVDEANMTPGRLFESVLHEAKTRGAKVIVVQDTAQLSSRDPGDFARLLWEKYGGAETHIVRRQRADWQKEASGKLNEGRIQEGLMPYIEKGCITWSNNQAETHEALVKAYIEDQKLENVGSRMSLAYRNADVHRLSLLVRQKLLEGGILKESSTKLPTNVMPLAIGERLRFTGNDHHGRLVKNTAETLFGKIKEKLAPGPFQGVKNGTLGTIKKLSKNQMIVRLDDGPKKNGRLVKMGFKDGVNFTYGYAMSIYKSEGCTFDRTYVAFDPLMNTASTLVAMTRHRESVRGFLNKKTFPSEKELFYKLGRSEGSLNVVDYAIAEKDKPVFERVQRYKDLTLESIRLREEGSHEKNAFGIWRERKEIAREITNKWEEHRPYMRLLGLRRETVERAAGIRSPILSSREKALQKDLSDYDRL